jgi:neopullulanase
MQRLFAIARAKSVRTAKIGDKTAAIGVPGSRIAYFSLDMLQIKRTWQMRNRLTARTRAANLCKDGRKTAGLMRLGRRLMSRQGLKAGWFARHRLGAAVLGAAVLALLLAAPAISAPAIAAPAIAVPEPFRARLPQDEVVYFLLPDRFENADPANDRGGIAGSRDAHGFDPADKAFYNGGDLKGVLARLDYIQQMGVTAIWLAPVFKNNPVQYTGTTLSSGYHGYWVTDFTDVDPHFGSRADLRALVQAAHARGMKVYLDIITNHTADIIRYRECPANDCVYRSRAEYPYSRARGFAGAPINQGFDGSKAGFANLTRPDYAWSPYVPAGQAAAKKPAWLNDPIYYHNRGETTFRGENSLDGDFAGLDDVFTEHPRVVAGFIEIYGQWIDDFGIDGYRIDTARHVNPEFWQAFVPAMKARAARRGIPNFHIFGEVLDGDPAVLARHTRVDGFPAVLDFGLQFALADVLGDVPGKPVGTERLARLFAADANYQGGAAAALALPTFTGNHDIGRFAWILRAANPALTDADLQQRVALGNAMMFLLRGQPVIYSGDEQGFIGTGGDQAARAPLFASAVPLYRDEAHLGSGKTCATASFDAAHPLYRQLALLAQIRAAEPALRRGLQTVRASGQTPGLFVVTRHVPGTKGETLVAFNTSTAAITMPVEVATASLAWRSVHGQCAPAAAAPGSVVVTLAPLDWLVCASR